jgi:hypothetical protein
MQSRMEDVGIILVNLKEASRPDAALKPPPWAPYTGVIAIPTMWRGGRVPPLRKHMNKSSGEREFPKGTILR